MMLPATVHVPFSLMAEVRLGVAVKLNVITSWYVPERSPVSVSTDERAMICVPSARMSDTGNGVPLTVRLVHVPETTGPLGAVGESPPHAARVASARPAKMLRNCIAADS